MSKLHISSSFLFYFSFAQLPAKYRPPSLPNPKTRAPKPHPRPRMLAPVSMGRRIPPRYFKPTKHVDPLSFSALLNAASAATTRPVFVLPEPPAKLQARLAAAKARQAEAAAALAKVQEEGAGAGSGVDAALLDAMDEEGIEALMGLGGLEGPGEGPGDARAHVTVGVGAQGGAGDGHGAKAAEGREAQGAGAFSLVGAAAEEDVEMI